MATEFGVRSLGRDRERDVSILAEILWTTARLGGDTAWTDTRIVSVRGRGRAHRRRGDLMAVGDKLKTSRRMHAGCE